MHFLRLEHIARSMTLYTSYVRGNSKREKSADPLGYLADWLTHAQ